MTASRKARGGRFPVRLIAILMIALAVGGLVLFVGASATKSYTAAIVTVQRINAGEALAKTSYEIRSFSGDPASGDILDAKTAPSFEGKIATSSIYQGAVLQASMFFQPVESFDPANPPYTNRISELIPKDSTGIVILGDPTSSLVQAGDRIAIYFAPKVTGSMATDYVTRLMVKRVLYAIPITTISDGARVSGTQFITDLSGQEAVDLTYAQRNGQLYIGLVSDLTNYDASVGPCTVDASKFASTYRVSIPGTVSAGGTIGTGGTGTNPFGGLPSAVPGASPAPSFAPTDTSAPLPTSDPFAATPDPNAFPTFDPNVGLPSSAPSTDPNFPTAGVTAPPCQ